MKRDVKFHRPTKNISKMNEMCSIINKANIKLFKRSTYLDSRDYNIDFIPSIGPNTIKDSGIDPKAINKLYVRNFDTGAAIYYLLFIEKRLKRLFFLVIKTNFFVCNIFT